MALLKKIKAATLVETLVATAIILVVFTIGSLSLNNIFQSIIKNNDGPFQARVNELIYLAENDKIAIPYYEETQQWEISIENVEAQVELKGLYKPKQTIKIKKIAVKLN